MMMLTRIGFNAIATRARPLDIHRRLSPSLVALNNVSNVLGARCFRMKMSRKKTQFEGIVNLGQICHSIDRTETTKASICETCKVHPAVSRATKLYHDHEGQECFDIASFCKRCLKVHIEEDEANRKRRMKEQLLEIGEAAIANMKEHLKGLEPTEQVPLSYAVDIFIRDIGIEKNHRKPPEWFQAYLRKHLSDELGISQSQEGWTCDKGRADLIDFKLWYFHKCFRVDG